MRFTLSDELAVGLKGPLFLIAGQLTGLVPKAEFHHIGATAIPGSLTKGDVDVLLRVDARDFISSVATLQQYFAINQRENWSDVYNRIKVESAGLGVVEYRNAKERYLSPIIASRPKPSR